MTEYSGEPLETPYENGKVLPHEEPQVYFDDATHFAAVEKLVDSGEADYHEARQRLGFDAVGAAQSLVNIETSPEKVGIAERLATVEQRFEFLPRTKQELSDTYDLIGKDLVAGAATHLNAVLNRQTKYMEEPSRTVRAIVTRYADYAKNARAEYAFLKQVEDSIGDGKGGIDASRLGREWQYSGSVARPVLHTLWMRDVAAYMRDEQGVDPLKELADGGYAMSSQRAMSAAQEMMTKGSKVAFSEAFHHSTRSEHRRFAFWVQALQEARRHKAAAAVAYGALVELGVEKDER